MKSYFSYIRVSTLKQGQSGTSLGEQHDAIERYATRWDLHVAQEFVEKETAAKSGRPVFTRMLRELQRRKADGVIIHKIDRSARNLKDWADLGELIDCGVEVHFANESLDLHSRGGRLSADIQAVVAADYIRNLREETRKGFYGRLKQGLYPCPAPAGYLDCGKGAPKKPDPAQAHFVKQAFELYATGRWGLVALTEEMYGRGLRGKHGQRVTVNGMSKILHNPFYIGVINIKKKGEMYAGKHAAIVPKHLFDRVQTVLAGKNIKKTVKHDLAFRKLLSCAECGTKLIGEVQKGHHYYRCQTKTCAQKTIREELIDEALREVFKELRFDAEENRRMRSYLKQAHSQASLQTETYTTVYHMQLEKLQNRISKLTDAYIDGMVDEGTYIAKKNSILLEEKSVKEKLEIVDATQEKILERVEKFIELINNAYSSYKLANSEEKRELIEIATSNLKVVNKKLIVELSCPFQIVAERQRIGAGSPSRETARTLSALLSQLRGYFQKNNFALPPVSKESCASNVQFGRAA